MKRYPFRHSSKSIRGGLAIFIPPPSRGFFGWLRILATLGFLPLGVGILALVGGVESDLGGALLLLVVFGLWLTGLAWRAHTVLRLGPESIVVKSRLVGLFRWTRTMNVSDLTNLRAYCSYADEWNPFTLPGISVDYRGKECRLAEKICKEEAEYLVDEIKKQYPKLGVLGA